MRPRRLAVLGTFDIENLGDLLLPLIVEHELTKRLGSLEIRRYSHRAKTSPEWPYEVSPLQQLPVDLQELDGLVLGGGHLVRFDKAVTAGFGPTADGLHHPTSYWLSPILAACSLGLPVVWNALGASSETPTWAKGLLQAALEMSAYVSVRDDASRAELGAVAGDVEIALVPDSALGALQLLDDHVEDAVGRLLRRLGVGDRYVIVQPSTRLTPARAQLQHALPAVAAAGVTLLELPISPALGDRPGVLGIDAPLIEVTVWPHPLVVAGIIRRAHAVIAHSLHLSTLALAGGVPVHRLAAAPGTKYAALQAFRDVQHSLTDEAQLADRLLAPRPSLPDPFLVERLRRLEQHWDRMASELVRGREPNCGAAFRRFLLGLPGELETAASPDAVQGDAEELRRGLERERRRSDELAQQVRAASRDLEARAVEVGRVNDRLRRTSDELVRLRGRRSVKGALRAAQVLRPAFQTLRRLRLLTPVAQTGSQMPGSRPALRATQAQEAAFLRQLLPEVPSNGRTAGPLVSIIILNRSGAVHLRRLLPALEQTTYRDVEVVVVDNGSDDDSLAYLDGLAPRFPLRVLRNADNRSFSAANNQGVEACSGELILLLNNDVEPITPGWLGRMVDTLEERDAGAVAPRLIYPRRPGLDNQGDEDFDDLTLQHRGVHFVTGDGVPRARNLGPGEDPRSAAAAAVSEPPALTAACLLVRRDAYRAAGGLDERYVYGAEDVDLCLRLRRLGWRLVYDGGAALWHHEYGTQNAQGRDRKRINRRQNREVFLDHWGPQVFREVFRDRVTGGRRWSESPLHVAITITRDDPETGWGDWYTAHELGEELERLGWRVTYAERYADRWYDLPADVDVLLVLLDSYDLRRAPSHAVTIAWVRNWTHRWLSHPWFDDYDIVLASSGTSKALIDGGSGHTAMLMPLATNPDRFRPRGAVSRDIDVLFVGNYWGEARGVVDAVPRLGAHLRTRIYGQGWDQLPAFSEVHRGTLPYDLLPDAYGSSHIVLDDTAGPTKPYGAVNTRVFDALAAGALVLSDNEVGVRELFDDEFPVWDGPDALATRVQALLDDPSRGERLVQRYRATVLEHHTYAVRARQLQTLLDDWTRAKRFGLCVGVPSHDHPESWGDYHYARAVQRQLRRRGHPTRVHLLAEWVAPVAARHDVIVHLFGLSDLRTRPAQISVLWNVSHPELMSSERAATYDLVLVASDGFARRLADQTTTPVIPLHQAADPERFRPEDGGPHHQLLFVGNSRKVRRRILDDLVPCDHELAVYGRHWTPDLLDPRHVRDEHIPNEQLHRYYAAADIVLNDHWDDMREAGFLSNRLYDALASGAFVISDHVDGIDAEFDGAVVTYQDSTDLHQLVERFLADPGARAAYARRGRAAVLARHTFAHRVSHLLDLLEPLLAEHTGSVLTQGRVERSRVYASV